MLAVRDESLRMELASELRGDGFRVTDTASSLHLVQLLCEAILEDQRAIRPDCLILDIEHPVDIEHPAATGLSLLAELRALGWNTPAILLSNDRVGRVPEVADRPPQGAERGESGDRSAMMPGMMMMMMLDRWQPAWVIYRPIEITTVRNMVWTFCLDVAHLPVTVGPHRRTDRAAK